MRVCMFFKEMVIHAFYLARFFLFLSHIFSEFIANREIISDNDMDTSSDDHMEIDEEEEIDIGHFNLNKEWQTLHALKNRPMLGVLPSKSPLKLSE